MSKVQGWIYKITNKVNGKVYVGQTVQKNVKYRWKDHTRKLNQNNHPNKHIQASWNKYGEENFVFEVIEEFNPEMNFDLNNLEKFWIKHYDSSNPEKGYNKTLGGDGSGTLTEEAKQKLRQVNLGKVQSAETIAKRVEKLKGQKRTEEHCSNISKSRLGINKGVRVSPNTEFKKGQEPWNKGLKNKQIGHNRKKIRCLNNDKIYLSQNEAAIELGISSKHISSVCSGKRNHTYGFKFQYINEELTSV